MVHDPLVSVIIPVYNVESYLAEALESVINQTYKKLEILIVDDGSTDRSCNICDVYASRDERIRTIHQENKGLSAARNAGLDRMTGEVCAFLDPDDAYENTFIEKLLTAMVRTDADLVVCKYTTHQTEGMLFLNGEQSMPMGIAGSYDRVNGLRALADERINVNVWNKLYRRELWEKTRYPNGYVYEDVDTMFRIFDNCYLIQILDETLYLYRNRLGSITATLSMKNIQDMNLACSHFASFIALRIPEIFTPKQERRWRQRPIRRMIVNYIKYSNSKGSEEIISREKLREKILSSGKKAGIETFDVRTRIAWHMLRIFPWLLKITYLVYRPIRLMALKTIGR
ncbi:MAG: glycosyltransferase family 2 protein [Clostridia bacterium]|nr:glycosyltransferase family 2 protein [Clostridia bacterium]